ncbi:MAG: hypothetical protein KF845_14075 [Cyclobacteriaceae bacterium]|nr:hypothetical protein [Cyclobacteriaceae bacterium]
MRTVLLVYSLFALCAFESSVKLVRTKVTPQISVLLPKDFRPMDDLDFGQRYPSVRKPIAAYTNPDRVVDFSINVSATQWPDANLEMAQKFFKAGLTNLFDNIEFASEGIHEVNGKRFIFFEFESRVRGNPMELSQREPVLNYTYIQYLVEPGSTLVFSFNCPRRIRHDWQETAGKMMTGIKIK